MLEVKNLTLKLQQSPLVTGIQFSIANTVIRMNFLVINAGAFALLGLWR